jgi:Dolichyl-phosphate-mannose-protein mannosyltransferase
MPIQNSERATLSRRLTQIVLILFCVLGVEGWLLLSGTTGGFWGDNSQVGWAIAGILAAITPPWRWMIWAILRRLRRPSPIVQALIAVLIAIASAAFLRHEALATKRDLFPFIHDEFQFLLQTRMLSAGHLWMPPHPLYDFYDTFYVLIQPKYAAQSFPGTAFCYLPVIWFNIAPWKWSILLTAAAIGLFYHVVTDLLGGLAGLLAAAMLATTPVLELVSTMVLAQGPMLLLGLATIWAYLHWRRSAPRWRALWGIVVGFVAGWMAVTRPADALILAIPVGLAILLDLRHLSFARAGASVAAIVIAASPWLTLQLAFDKAVTGSILETPFDFYNQRDQPGLTLGPHTPGLGRQPVTTNPEKLRYYHDVVVKDLREHQPRLFWRQFVDERLPIVAHATLPQPLLVMLALFGLLVFVRRRVWVIVGSLPLFFLIYAFYPMLLWHYTLIVAPASVLLILGLPIAIGRGWPRARHGAWIALTFFVLGILFTRPVQTPYMLAVEVLHESMLQAANSEEAGLIAAGRPAVILFRRDKVLTAEVEPVYNLLAAWPDDELVIRAHDLGERNSEIFNYYAKHGPNRAFYLFDEAGPYQLQFLGMASELSKTKSGHANSPP